MGKLLLAAAVVACGVASGQAPLVNTGAPLRVELECAPSDMEALGLACPPASPCDAYLELSAVESAGSRVFLMGNIHTDSVTIHSILLATSDSAKTWSEPYARVRGAALDRVQFFDNEIGWIGGQVVQPLPRDPFLLKTTDGGATWRRYPIFSEARAGVVDGFHFGSKTSGLLWIDRGFSGEPGGRYERYESATGGESWMLREAANRPPSEPGAPRPQTQWRLRPDGAAKVYRLERAAEGQWLAAASFLISLGQCKSQPGALAEPPPEPAPEAPATPRGSKPAPRSTKK
jgi:photosystem II stability/assembly factor-like uncharacterized protein